MPELHEVVRIEKLPDGAKERMGRGFASESF
jgi:hypothetical protein